MDRNCGTRSLEAPHRPHQQGNAGQCRDRLFAPELRRPSTGNDDANDCGADGTLGDVRIHDTGRLVYARI